MAGKSPSQAARHAGPPDPSAVAGARRAPASRSLAPQLCTLARAAPEGPGWIHEIKFDGYRLMARRERGTVRLLTRTGKDWTGRFAPIARAIAGLPGSDGVLDGEACIMDERGRTSFQRLQNAIKDGDFGRLVFWAFDLLHLDGHDLTRCALLDRKSLLRRLLAGGGVLRYTDHVAGSGGDVQANACRLGLEGIVSKRADAPYEQARSRSWLKVKCSRRQEFVVVGFTPPSGSRRHFGSLLLGAHDGRGRLVYTGKVGTGFDERSLREIHERLEALRIPGCPTDPPPDAGERRDARWVRPSLVAEVEFTQWTDDGRLRHPSFQGWREDKPAADVRLEHAAPGPEEIAMTPPAPPPPARPKRTGRAADAEVAGVRLTSPDRVLYPNQGLTKLDLARYAEAVADRMLPYVADRPLSTVRCPTGRTGQCFYQKHVRETFGGAVKSITVREDEGEADYIGVDSAAGLVTLVQFGVLEIHPWGCAAGDPEVPEILTFDLDPGEGVAFDAVKGGAVLLRERLAGLGLTPFLKTTGGKGLHVVAPIAPGASWEDAKAFAAGLAREIAGEAPDRYTATLSKDKRRGRVFIDYLRNGRGATAVAPYSTRARPDAPVATPLRWDELGRLASPARYDVGSVRRRLSSLGSDPWEGFADARAPLPPGGATG